LVMKESDIMGVIDHVVAKKGDGTVAKKQAA
jgi:hypothetical protein